MLPLLLLSNPRVTDKMLAAAGYAAGLGEMDVRQLSQTRIPVWAVALVCFAAGAGTGIWLARKLPPEWVLGKKREEK